MSENWEWPEQKQRLTLDTVKHMKCDHHPYNLNSTVKVNSDTDKYYCLKCWKVLGHIQDYVEYEF